MIRCRTLGALELRGSVSGEHVAVLSQPKRAALLVYLAVATPRGFHRRDTLLALFWPELDQEHARAALRQSLRFLRRELGREVIQNRGAEEVGLDPAAVWCDAVEFEAAFREGDLEGAFELYRGDFLPGLHVAGCKEFERWVERRRSELRELAADAAGLLVERAEAKGSISGAMRWARRRVTLRADDERALQRVLRLLDRAGDRAGALREYEVLVRRLALEYQVEPSPETQALVAAIRARQGAPHSTARPAPPGGGAASAPATGVPDGSRTGAGGHDASGQPGRRPRRRKVAAIVASLAVLAAIALAGWYARWERKQWARTAGLAEIERLESADRWDSVYTVGRRVAALIPTDSAFVHLWRTIAYRTRITTIPPGAKLFWRPYDETDTTSVFLGTTPLDSVRIPMFASRLRLELPHYQTQDLVALAGHYAAGGPVVGRSFVSLQRITLDPAAEASPDMVRVMGFALPQDRLHLPRPLAVEDFWLGRYEVTNRQFREFVDAGGYRRPEYWTEPFVRNGRTVPWREAMKQFVDRTGRPGPSTWETGSYPDGQDDYPVGGVSWYEAAAYARFAKLDLPTYWHWTQGLPPGMLYKVVPRSNLGRGRGPAPVGSYKGMGAFGTYDQAGNAREWVYNQQNGKRLIMGGAWSDPDWLALWPVTASPWDRSAINGFRLARYAGESPALAAARAPVRVEPPARDYRVERPVRPRDVEIFTRLYSYDPMPLDARLERADTARDWVRERVSFTAAYGEGRMAAYLYLPRRGRPPYQTVVYWPGSLALDYRTIDELPEVYHDFFMRAGRAVLLPLYLGTFDRDDEQFSLSVQTQPPRTGARYRDLVIEWVKDLRRSIDYLVTRPDIDTARVAFYGCSWGGEFWPNVLAVEPRIKVGISYIGGLFPLRYMPEIDPFNFLPAVRTPLLMLASRYDPVFPFDTEQKPMFDLAGTPAKRKRLFVFDGTHYIPLDVAARESLAWLDRYLGPVKPAP